MTNVKRFIVIIKNVAISYVVTLILFMLYAFLLSLTNIPESSIPLSTFVISMVSVFIGSSLTVIKIKEKGLINGGLVGLFYILLVYLLGSIFVTGFGLTGYSFSMIIFNVIVGMIGGIIGVNMQREGK